MRFPEDLDATRLADVCAFQLVVDATVRQRILEELRPVVRVRLVVEELMLQAAAFKKPAGKNSIN